MSIMEVLFAMYFLTLTVLAVLNLYQAALQGSAKTDQRMIATAIADKQLARLRAYATDSGNFADWTSIDGVSQPDDEYPDYTVTTESEPYTQYSPCSALEGDWPVEKQRTMTASVRKVRVTVQWSPSPSNRVRLTTLIAGPPRELDSVSIEAGSVPDPVERDGTAEFTATGLDGSGDPIPDLFFEWWVLPGTGNGTLNVTRTGANCTFQHRYEVPETTPIYYPLGSSCEVEVRGRYRGQEKTDRKRLNLSDS